MTSARILIVNGETHSSRPAHSSAAAAIPVTGRNGAPAFLDHLQPSDATVLVRDGRDAVHEIERDPSFDLVLWDLSTESLRGETILARVHNTLPDTPIIVTASPADRDAALAAVDNGAYDYLTTPIERERLLSTVKRAIEYRRLRQQNAAYRQNLEQLVSARTEILNQMVTDLERSYDITLEALGDALDLKDAETEGHSKRVTAYTIALARGMGLSPEQIRVIARGAFLHDIGKMAIPDAILLKPGDLRSNEQKVMREHCSLGYQMLRKIPFLQEAAEIVYSHQERFDGGGYPRGLKGEEIPLGARIFSIADTVDAITSDRPYRKARNFAAARGEIKRCAGSQFDPQVVATYLSLPDRLWEDLRGEINQHAKRFSPFAFAATAASKLRNPFG